TFDYPFEYLRVYSPSAEVKGHGPGQETLQIGKEDVQITDIEPVGHYAVRLVFDDGHNTGLYTWVYLRELAENMESNWQAYLDRLQAAGYARKNPEKRAPND
ncbi:MAG: gamma-butyrobetaine hydroxylase-like domain-containing protein, partial [Woeseiaceae bacterium]